MKKLLAALLVMTMTVSLVSCSKEEKAKDNNSSDKTETKIEETKDESKEDKKSDESKDYMNLDYTDKAMDYLNYIADNLSDRDISSKDGQHAETIEWIVSELKNAGYDDSQINLDKVKSSYPGTEVQNVELTIEGEDNTKQVIIGGHFDGDGVGDNGSGLALLLANAVGLKNEIPKYKVKIVFFDGEELGMLGSEAYVSSLSQEEIDSTIYMVNIDSIAFGDYCNVYGGGLDLDEDGNLPRLDAYEYACSIARSLGYEVWGPEELDGYFAEHETGPEIKDKTIYTNPWTANNPAPGNTKYLSGIYSPATLPASDHFYFDKAGIPYVYFEATNWFADGDKSPFAYTGYIETYDSSLGEGGMFMNTKFDTLENLNEMFPGRAEEHFHTYSPILSVLILNPNV